MTLEENFELYKGLWNSPQLPVTDFKEGIPKAGRFELSIEGRFDKCSFGISAPSGVLWDGSKKFRCQDQLMSVNISDPGLPFGGSLSLELDDFKFYFEIQDKVTVEVMVYKRDGKNFSAQPSFHRFFDHVNE